MILTLILDFSEHFVSLSYAAATTARGTFAVSAHAALRRCRARLLKPPSDRLRDL